MAKTQKSPRRAEREDAHAAMIAEAAAKEPAEKPGTAEITITAGPADPATGYVHGIAFSAPHGVPTTLPLPACELLENAGYTFKVTAVDPAEADEADAPEEDEADAPEEQPESPAYHDLATGMWALHGYDDPVFDSEEAALEALAEYEREKADAPTTMNEV